MQPSEFKNAVAAGDRVYGTLVTTTSPRWPQALARVGLDFVFIDTEHIPIDRALLSWMCHAYRGVGLAPLVRIPAVDPDAACGAIDGGAAGIVAPYMETVEQVRALVAAVKLRPLKGRTAAAAADGTEKLAPALQQYVDRMNRDLVLLANIESAAALENLDALLAVPGLDGALIGPHDLSCNLGVPEQYDHPKFREAVSTIIRRARAAGRTAGIHTWMDLEQEVAWGREGLNLFIHSSDIVAATRSLGTEVSALRARLGDHVSTETGTENI